MRELFWQEKKKEGYEKQAFQGGSQESEVQGPRACVERPQAPRSRRDTGWQLSLQTRLAVTRADAGYLTPAFVNGALITSCYTPRCLWSNIKVPQSSEHRCRCLFITTQPLECCEKKVSSRQIVCKRYPSLKNNTDSRKYSDSLLLAKKGGCYYYKLQNKFVLNQR